MAPIASPEPAAPKSEKKFKKDKASKSERKRAREEDAAGDERRHKKSKSVIADNAAQEPTVEDAAVNGDVKADKKKKKKDKKDKLADNGATEVEAVPAAEDEAKSEKKKSKKKKHKEAESTAPEEPEVLDGAEEEKKKKKKSKKDRNAAESEAEPEAAQTTVANDEETTLPDADAMDIDTPAASQPSKSSKSKIHQPLDMPANPQFPFFTQTVSLYEPLYPIGWAQPVTSCQYQHLRHLQNKYVPSLRGVLMDYKNVAFGEKPGRHGAATDDEQPAKVMASAEYAVGYGWITADVDLFVPSRGAWMEGSVNLQTEGHIGVVCFGKFNASIEARRLPPAWKWVPNESPDAHGFEETASVMTADDHGVVRQIHSTGFWVDAAGERVQGKTRFRIRNFDVGTNGETSYLSLEGTMLDKRAEKALVADEAKTAQMRKARKGGAGLHRRRIPEFAMTRFAVADEEQQQTETDEVEKREILAVEDGA